jgi:hypothetical protein
VAESLRYVIHGVAFAFACCFCCCFVICEGGVVLFFMSGAVEGMGVVRGLIVTRVADCGLGPTGGAHIALALRELTGLQTLNLRCT